MTDEKIINLVIDGENISVPQGTTIMDAAEKIGIHIPRLCYHPDFSLEGSCRVCIVEVEGVPFFMTSCSTQVSEGMKVKTNSPEIRQARRDIIELILDNHPQDCQTCKRSGTCELQDLAYAYGIEKRLFAGAKKNFPIDNSSKSIVRDPNKCILCNRCVRVCEQVQGVNNLSQQKRGMNTEVGPCSLKKMDDSVCIQCGQCINVCPTAALREKDGTEAVWKALGDPTKHVVVHTAPSIRAAIGEGFGHEPGTNQTGKMVTALRRLGFHKVFDTNFTADLTIMEEATELVSRIKNGGVLPLLTSCSPGWINFLEKFYPELIPNASSCKSPMGMMSTLLKTYYAEKMGLKPEDIFVVAVMPCVAKKYEASRPEHFLKEGVPFTDAVLTTRELIYMIKCYGIEFNEIPDGVFDNPLGESSGAADIFGSTGGVMEAALRTAYEVVTGKNLDHVEFESVRAVEGLREREIDIDGTKIKVAVANGINNAKIILEKVKKGEEQFHVIEIMACPGGCVCGGGQPHPPKGWKVLDQKLRAARAGALYTIDSNKKLRKSHENESIKKLYKEYLGEPGGEKAHHLLHTTYKARLPRGVK